MASQVPVAHQPTESGLTADRRATATLLFVTPESDSEDAWPMGHTLRAQRVQSRVACARSGSSPDK